MSKKATTKAQHQPPVDEDGVLILRGELFWKWRALDADIKRTRTEADAKQATIDAEIAKHDVLKSLIGDKHALVREHSQHVLEMHAVHVEMEKTLGVDIKNVSIDDKSGRVHVLDADGTPTPLKPKTKRSKTVRK